MTTTSAFATWLRRRRPTLILLAAVLAIPVAMLGWHQAAAVARNTVSVQWAGEVTCRGTQVRDTDVGRESGPAPTIWMREGMECRIPVRVLNDGWVAVHVRDVVLPYMGQHGGMGARAIELEGVRLRPPGWTRDEGAVFALGRELDPGESWRFDAELVFRPRGCSSPDVTESFSGLPTLVVDALGWSGDVPTGSVIAFRGTADSSCDG